MGCEPMTLRITIARAAVGSRSNHWEESQGWSTAIAPARGTRSAAVLSTDKFNSLQKA